MLKIEPPDYKFCPFCGETLEKKEREGKIRKFCPKDNWEYFPHVATAAVAVIQKDDEFLMVKRNREPYKGTWMFPAGFTDYGEHPAEAAIREVVEETGYKANNAQLIDVIQVDDDPRAMGHFGFFYKVEIGSDAPSEITDKEENQDMRWFKLDDFPEIGWKSHQLIAQRLKDKKI